MYKTTVEQSNVKVRQNIRIRIGCSIWYHSSSAARNAPVLLRGFVVVFFPLLRPLEVPRVELEPRENDAFRPKPRPPLVDPVETQGSGQSGQAKISTGRVTSPDQRSPLLSCPLLPHLKHSTPVVPVVPLDFGAVVLERFKPSL